MQNKQYEEDIKSEGPIKELVGEHDMMSKISKEQTVSSIQNMNITNSNFLRKNGNNTALDTQKIYNFRPKKFNNPNVKVMQCNNAYNNSIMQPNTIGYSHNNYLISVLAIMQLQINNMNSTLYRMQNISENIDIINTKFDSINERLDNITNIQKDLKYKQGNLAKQINQLEKNVAAGQGLMEDYFINIYQQIDGIENQINNNVNKKLQNICYCVNTGKKGSIQDKMNRLRFEINQLKNALPSQQDGTLQQ